MRIDEDERCGRDGGKGWERSGVYRERICSMDDIVR